MPPIGRLANPQLTREQVLSTLIQPLMQENVLLAAGPVIYDSDGSQLRVPKIDASADDIEDTRLYGEHDLIEDEDIEWDSLILLPPNLLSVKTLVPFSNEVLRSAVIPLEAAIRDRMVYKVSRKLDYLFFQGTGVPDSKGRRDPIGMLNWADQSASECCTGLISRKWCG
jgi:HK97 family phage major capsid protein